MKRNNHASVVRLTSLAILAALVVVLQTVASGIRIGPVPISLTLVPIVVGAILFGPGAGAGLGFVFGLVCLIAGVTGDLVAKVKAGELVNHVATQVGGKGGGRPDMAQAGGTDPASLPAALQSVRGWVEQRL